MKTSVVNDNKKNVLKQENIGSSGQIVRFRLRSRKSRPRKLRGEANQGFMMFLNELGCDQSPDQMARMLRQLADDLQRVPDKSYLLALEPEAGLASWSYCARQMVCLTGTTVNHPEFDKARILTSEVFYLNRQVGLVRTLSRWYRLLDQAEVVEGQGVDGSPLL